MKGTQPLWLRWLKFNVVGAVGICVQLGALALLTSGLGLNYLIATALAVEAAALHNFLWHERFTWSDRCAHSRLTRLLKFNFTTGSFSLLGNVIITKLLAEAGCAYLLANAAAIVLCSIINFMLNDRFVFIRSQEQ